MGRGFNAFGDLMDRRALLFALVIKIRTAGRVGRHFS